MYGGDHGPRPHATHRSLAASAQVFIDNVTAAGVHPRLPSGPSGRNIPERTLSWKAQCESSRVAALTVTRLYEQPVSRDAT